MATTRVFKSGNSLAVRLPRDIAFAEGTEVVIARQGDSLTVSPARLDMASLVARLRVAADPHLACERPEFKAPRRAFSDADKKE